MSGDSSAGIMADTFGELSEGVLGIGILVVAGTGRMVSGIGGTSAGTGGVVRPVRMVVSCWMAVMYLFVSGACGNVEQVGKLSASSVKR
jgi:hypothetical protein